MAADVTYFLDRSWRMPPEITAFVSDLACECRLAAAPGRERQSVQAPRRLTGSGLRFVPVEHSLNAAGSDEEVAVVAQSLDLDDVLVVAPYNNQVGQLRRAFHAAPG